MLLVLILYLDEIYILLRRLKLWNYSFRSKFYLRTLTSKRSKIMWCRCRWTQCYRIRVNQRPIWGSCCAYLPNLCEGSMSSFFLLFLASPIIFIRMIILEVIKFVIKDLLIDILKITHGKYRPKAFKKIKLCATFHTSQN